MNNIKITGRITHDLELKYTPNGVAVCSFSVAVDRGYKTAGGEKQTDFFNVVAWRQQAEFVCKYFSKGRLILADGEMQSRKYTDKSGNERIMWEISANKIEFMGDKPAGGSAQTTPQPAQAVASATANAACIDDDPDAFPF